MSPLSPPISPLLLFPTIHYIPSSLVLPTYPHTLPIIPAYLFLVWSLYIIFIITHPIVVVNDINRQIHAVLCLTGWLILTLLPCEEIAGDERWISQFANMTTPANAAPIAGSLPNTTAAPNSQTPGHPSFRRWVMEARRVALNDM